MEIKIGSKYIIVINSMNGQKILTYIATIDSQDDMFVTFTDVRKNTLTFNKNVIVSLTPYDENFKSKKEGEGDDQ